MNNSSRDTINFAERVLTLLAQGKFTSTYKYAVLLSLIDLSMEKFIRSGTEPESFTTRQLSEKIIEIYWLHTNPFNFNKSKSEVLHQNNGTQAKILKLISEFRKKTKLGAYAPYFSAKFSDIEAYNKLVKSVEWILIKMPLPRLQRMGATTNTFIYYINWDDDIQKSVVNCYQNGEFSDFDNLIRLQPYVASYFIQLNGLLRPLIQREWSMRVAKVNKLEESRLQMFLFNNNRASTDKLKNDLIELQSSHCFYCKNIFGVKKKSKPEVDHFIPWSRYPNDSLSNFVMACNQCNGSKRDFLAKELFYESWKKRLNCKKEDLASIANLNNWELGLEISNNIGNNIYSNLQKGVELWGPEGFTKMV